jgi:transposase
MPRRLQLELSGEQQAELVEVRDHHSQPHMREKAAALLKIAAGQAGSAVAHGGLLKQRDTDTIYRWVRRYRAEGLAGLSVRRGRGRKAAFSP